MNIRIVPTWKNILTGFIYKNPCRHFNSKGGYFYDTYRYTDRCVK